MSQREEFISFALQDAEPFKQLCARFGISRKTGYKWLERYRLLGKDGLVDQSRKPLHSPGKTPDAIRQSLCLARAAHPGWGGRKLRRYLAMQGQEALPAPSIITKILRQEGHLDPTPKTLPACHRFAREEPNQLWQMDFKGHFAVAGGRCHPLTLLDDCSRFSLAIQAHANEQGAGVQVTMQRVLEQYGMPQQINTDNGPPWGSPDPEARYTTLGAWLIRLGIRLTYSRPYHPQTNGKIERFHRSLKREVLEGQYYQDCLSAQQAFDRWRHCYNHERPHEGIEMAVPASLYTPSYRLYPSVLPVVEYDSICVVKRVDRRGCISVEGRYLYVGKAFTGQPVGLQPTEKDGVYKLYYCRQKLGVINLPMIDKKSTCQNIYTMTHSS